MERSMNDERSAWQIVAIGLRVKLIAMWGFGVFLLMLWGQTLVLSLLIPVLAVDLMGRTFCVAAPIPRRASIHCSVICQIVGITVLAVSAFWKFTVLVALHIVGATVCQLFAAFFFTNFLGEVAEALGRHDLGKDVNELKESLRRTTWAGISLGAYLIVVVMITLLLLMIFYYGGICIAAPFLMIAWIPGVLFTIPVLGNMVIKYATTIPKIRKAVIEAATIPISPGQNG